MNKIVQEDLQNIIKNGDFIWEQFAASRVLVTGASGLIPYYFAATLLSLNETVLKGRECRVVALVRSREKARKKFADFLDRKDLELIVQDVSGPLEIKGPVDYIIHAASQASPKYYGIDPVGTMLPNIIGTNNLLSLARDSKSKGFLFVSGGEIYGIVPDNKVPTKELDYGWLDPVNVRSCYGESKRAGETLCASWQAQYGVPTVIARLAHTYGPGLSLDDGRVFADFVRDIVEGRDIELNSDGSASRSFCYVTDAVLGMFVLLLKGERGKAYNVCNETACVSILELARTLAGLFPKKNISVKFSASNGSPGYIKSPVPKACLDSSALKALGWKPLVGIKDGFTRTVLSFS
ncbi:MAG: NAD-dependent epimerase/dehydratase family protein [Elusimicrobiales bacterium]|nr:NAD-dependent epimerase/dehydratase family protein [Elusimicrobiales bacterium]